MCTARLPDRFWVRVLLGIVLWAGVGAAQQETDLAPSSFPPRAPAHAFGADAGAPPADVAPLDAEVVAPVPALADGGAPVAGARLLVTFRSDPPGRSTAGIIVQSDDGASTITSDAGSAELELAAGQRTLRLLLPLPLTPAHPGPEPRVIRLQGIELGEAMDAELRVALGADGTPTALELVPRAPAAVDSAPAPLAEGAATEAKHGQISGRVVAKSTATRVSGVNVFVEGSPDAATSDAEGRFTLRLPVGRHTLWIIHGDYPTLTLPDVEVKEGVAAEIVVELSAPTGERDDWVIRARYVAGTVATLLEERRKATTVSDALGSEEIAKSADSSASAATRRIVGASIVGGQYLFARGLGGRYTNVRLNGVPLPSTDPDLPGFQLDLFPASLLSSLTITKTFSPDIPGDFAGGSLNVLTRSFPSELELKLSTSVSWNTETTGRNIPRAEGGALDFLGIEDGTRELPSAVPGQRVWTGSGLGLEQLVSISRSFRNAWDIGEGRALPNLSFGASLGDSWVGDAGRLGYLVTLGYRHRYERFDETITRVGLASGGDSVVPIETLTREVGNRDAQIGALGSLSYEPTPRHRLSAVTLLTQTAEDRAARIVGFSEAEGTEIENTQARFIERQLIFSQLTGEHQKLWDRLTLTWQLNASRTLRDQPETADLLYARGPSGELEFRVVSGSGERLYSELNQNDLGAGLSASLALFEGTALEAGYLGRRGRRDFGARRFGIQYEGSAAERALPPEELLAPERAGDTWLIDELTQPSDGYTAQEDLHAAYAMLNAQLFEPLRIMGGVRLERFHQKIDIASPFALDNRAPPPGADRTDLDYLPAGALIVAPSADMNVRVGYGGTVARPLVRELAPFLNQDFVRRRYAQGNPALERTFIHNFDARWEFFPSATDVFAASAFYKQFQDPIETVVLDQNGNISFENIDAATNYGVELEARVGLALIAPSLSSWNALANVALIRSEVSLSPEQQRLATTSERPLAGQSPFVANVALGYEGESPGISAYVYYNVFGRRIQDVGRLGLPDVYEEPFHALDATAFWKLGGGLTLGISGSNLLFQPVRLTQGTSDFSRAYRGANFGMSLSWAP